MPNGTTPGLSRRGARRGDFQVNDVTLGRAEKDRQREWSAIAHTIARGDVVGACYMARMMGLHEELGLHVRDTLMAVSVLAPALEGWMLNDAFKPRDPT
jgi:hypothetical protein